MLTYGLFALGFNLLYGYTGLLSFGHAAYYGLGAYGTGIALAKLHVTSLWGALGIGVVAAALGGAVAGFFCLRRRGIYFAMLTLAFAQLLYFIAFHLADWTGGDDGLRGIPLHPLWLPGVSVSLRTPFAFYCFAFVLVILAVAVLKRILDSPFGARAPGHPREPRARVRVRLRRQPDQARVVRLLGVLRGPGGRARSAPPHGRAGRVALLVDVGPGRHHDAARRRRNVLRPLRRRGDLPACSRND